MSTINVNNLSGKGGATPNLPDGAVISGVATITNLKPTNVNVSGAVTATTFDGSLKSTGTPTLGLGVTINSSGLVVSGVTTAGIGSFTTVYGDGSNLTGVGGSIGVWYYNPPISDTNRPLNADTLGIAVTFSTKVVAGSGTATMKIVNAGVAGTTIQSWGIGSCTFSVDTPQKLTFGATVSALTSKQTYQIDIPEGFVKDMGGTEYVGTAWTFATTDEQGGTLYIAGTNTEGALGLNTPTSSKVSSPVQIPGTKWTDLADTTGVPYMGGAIRNDGTLWIWGANEHGELRQNQAQAQLGSASSPVQIPGTDWGRNVGQFGSRLVFSVGRNVAAAIKNDGTLWTWGKATGGRLGHNGPDNVAISSPTQVPGTNWTQVVVQPAATAAMKTDGTLWIWGDNGDGRLGQNQPQPSSRSSPVQIPGTNWDHISAEFSDTWFGVKTDGTLWTWGNGANGSTAQNNVVQLSSPTQIPGTTWATASGHYNGGMATKTDGTLWTWGTNAYGGLGQNNRTEYSSPVQVPGTTWSTTRAKVTAEEQNMSVIKTDGTLWTWGRNEAGELGQNQSISQLAAASSPVQVGSQSDWVVITDPYDAFLGIRE